MAENAKENNSSKKVIVILLIIIIILLLIGGIAAAAVILTGNKDDTGSGEAVSEQAEPDETSATKASYGGIIEYQGGVVNAEDIQGIYDNAQKDANEGTMSVSYKPSAKSYDGTHFTCEIDNPPDNSYDMYLNIYTDSSFEKQVLLTGLIPPGSGIVEFDSEIKLEPGDYEDGVLVMTLVEDDHSTLRSQSMVRFKLYVIQE